MTQQKVWVITGASRGMGLSFVRAALAAGHSVVATGRRIVDVAKALGESDRLLFARLDVTSRADADEAVAAAVARFGRIDVVVNSAGASYKGFFEEMSAQQVSSQLEINLVGPMNVTRAVLPTMREQGSGHLVMISSGAALMPFEYSSVYAASKAGLEAWTGALEQEVAPFGIRTTIVNPGFFRTTLASPESLIFPEVTVPAYADRSAAQREWWLAQDGRQPGDPEKLAAALVATVGSHDPPRRLIAGADALALAGRKVDELSQQIEQQLVSGTLDFNL
jgi:NAD(P)-dependent dehydrogenase (short-subunit alcohol dehydrogenase family)